ncbi:hypothetical protein [Thermosulfuriphilus sp.]
MDGSLISKIKPVVPQPALKLDRRPLVRRKPRQKDDRGDQKASKEKKKRLDITI